MGSTVEQAWSHLDEHAGYAGKRGRHDDKTCATRSSGQVGMGYSFPGEETAKFQEHSSIEQSYWNHKARNDWKNCRSSDDGDNEELEHDVRSFMDRTTYLTTAVLRRGVEITILYPGRPQSAR